VIEEILLTNKRNITIEIINSKGIEGILMTKGKTDLEGILMNKGKTGLEGIHMININKEIGVVNSKGEIQGTTGASSKGGAKGNSRNSKVKIE